MAFMTSRCLAWRERRTSLYYENLDKTIAGSISCENTYPNFAEQTIQVELKKVRGPSEILQR